MPLTIRFFVQFSGKSPKIQKIFVNGEQICFNDPDSPPNTSSSKTKGTIIVWDNLGLEKYPRLNEIPAYVDNVSYQSY